MRINKASEAILAKYSSPKQKFKIEPFYKTQSEMKKGGSLQDFYDELHSKSHYFIEQVYTGKNAKEIESMMMQNRKLIESNHKAQY